MAPEQAGFGPVSPATDYYAIGVLLFECLTGTLPFRGTAMEILLHKQENDPPDPTRLVAGVPPALGELCMRLLARDPAERPGCDEMLAAFSAETIGAPEDPSVRRTRRARCR